MRKILFRAKRIDNGEWVEGFYAIAQDRKGLQQHNILLADNNYGYYKWYEIKPDTICQYTGLNDKDGNKIWENDVVRYEDDLSNMVKEDLIVWNETHAAFTRLHKSKMGLQYLYINEFIASNSEVIGNIFDNPELLKVGD